MARMNVEDLLVGKLKRPLVEYSYATWRQRYMTQSAPVFDLFLIPCSPFDLSEQVFTTPDEDEAERLCGEINSLIRSMLRIQRAVDGTR